MRFIYYMRNYKDIVLIAILLLAPVFGHAQSFKNAQSVVLAHTWGSQRLPGAIWGIAVSDVDGDGIEETLLLKSNQLVVGHINDNGFVPESTYEWDGLLEAVKLYTVNLDDDAAEEIIVSAMEANRPSSFGLKFTDGKFETLFSKAPWHLRVLRDNIGKLLIGQQWDTTSFFQGPIYFLSVEGKKIKRGERLPLPKWATIYNFDALGTDSRLVRIEPYEHVMIYEKRGKKFKRIWSSGGRYGGGLNLVDFEARQPLGEANQEGVIINREPLVITGGTPLILAVEHDVPLKGVIGRRAWIPRGKIVAFGEDPSLGFQNKFETVEIQGYIADYAVFEKKLIVPVQIQPSMWRENEESTLLIFDLPITSIQ